MTTAAINDKSICLRKEADSASVRPWCRQHRTTIVNNRFRASHSTIVDHTSGETTVVLLLSLQQPWSDSDTQSNRRSHYSTCCE